jgi:hypothetical protein
MHEVSRNKVVVHVSLLTVATVSGAAFSRNAARFGARSRRLRSVGARASFDKKNAVDPVELIEDFRATLKKQIKEASNNIEDPILRQAVQV